MAHEKAYHHGNLRQVLLDQALREITASGIEQLSLRSVARNLGVSHAAPSRHFPNKSALLSALAIDGYQSLMSAMRTSIFGVQDTADRIRTAAKANLEWSLENAAYLMVLQHVDVRDSKDEALAWEVKEYTETLTALITAAQKDGWNDEADTAVLALGILSWVTGAVTLLNNRPFTSALKQEDTETFIDRLLETAFG